LEKALEMSRRIYPPDRFSDGHPVLAVILGNLGGAVAAMGDYAGSMPYHEQSLAMIHRLNRRMTATASEAEALAFLQTQPHTFHGLLSFSLLVPDTAAAAYGAVWSHKAAVSRVLEQRHAAARVAGTDHAATFNRLREVRREIDRLLQDRRLPPGDRDRKLAASADERDRLERALANVLPVLKKWQELDASGPETLVSALPREAVLIDVIRYVRFERDPTMKGRAAEKQAYAYAAFVLAASQPIRRIELGEAKPIDQLVARWRTAIAARADDPAAGRLRDLVWSPLAKHLPAGVTTIYLSPDGDLARMPWAALPAAGGRVLLEEYALTVVPHARFVLHALNYPRVGAASDSALLVGGLDYGATEWPTLPGTMAEVKSLAALTPGRRETLSRAGASTDRLAQLLPGVRYAHLATHGYFDSATLSAEKSRAAAAMKERQFGDDARLVAPKNPLGFTGLVLADGEIMTGLRLVDLSLENLKLVTLSACETGLGDLTGGEGVQGLQRAFHLAGCPNVVASLWKVSDAATAALMAKFYHEMWVNKKEPIEALRTAQLTIYHHPELIPDLSGVRGAPKAKEALAVSPLAALQTPAKPRTARADTKLWAAFVLSGAGQ